MTEQQPRRAGGERGRPGGRRRGSRPEETAGLAAVHYDGAEAARYTAQSAQIQRELTRRALQLLPLDLGAGPPRLLADVGCGSGLSGEVLAAAGAAAWAGIDLSLPMLLLAAAAAPGCAGRLALGDIAHGLPLRRGCLDGAISISALQWLCRYPDPGAALRTFFNSLHGCLSPGACAALQVYAQDDGDVREMLGAAESCGFRPASYFVDYPHPQPAKKYFLCVQRPAAEEPGAAECPPPPACASHTCSLAWPRQGSCALSWQATLSKQGQQLPGWPAVAARLQREHLAAGRRLLRLLRRAGAGAGGSGRGGSGGGGGGDCSRLLAADLEVLHPGLMPCGGTIAVHLVASEAQLAAAAARGPSAGSQPGSPASPGSGGWGAGPSSDCRDSEELREGATALAQSLLNSSGGSGGDDSGGSAAAVEVVDCSVAAAPPPATAPGSSSPGEQQQAQQHVWMEAVPGLEGQDGRRWRASLLRAPKAPAHLVIHTRAPLAADHAAHAELARRVAALCRARRGCLVALEARVLGEEEGGGGGEEARQPSLGAAECSLSWVLFLPDAPGGEAGGALADALQRWLQ